MQPIYFEGSKQIGKPENMTDEQCMAIWARPVDYTQEAADGQKYRSRFWEEEWMPSREDLMALNAGRPIKIQIHCGKCLVPIAIYTVDENGQSNDAG